MFARASMCMCGTKQSIYVRVCMNRPYARLLARSLLSLSSLSLQCQCSPTVHTLVRLGARVTEHIHTRTHNNDGHHFSVLTCYFFPPSLSSSQSSFFLSNLIEHSDRHICIQKKSNIERILSQRYVDKRRKGEAGRQKTRRKLHTHTHTHTRESNLSGKHSQGVCT